MAHPRAIRTAAVLGAGTMGAQIAAHLANAGIPSHLLDLTRDHARDGLKRAAALKPDPFYTRHAAALVTTGGFDTDFGVLATVDWIIEAVVERIDVKRALLERVDAVRGPGTIVSSNTSGMSIAALAEGRSADFRRHWLGTHFFNPPRYLRLLEIVPTSSTEPAVVDHLSEFADHRLGKGIVVATGHAQLHRQPHRPVRRGGDASGAGDRGLHHRGDRRHHGARDRPSEERDVPHDGPRRARHPRARGTEPGRAPGRSAGAGAVRSAANRRHAGRARVDRRQGGAGLLQARAAGEGESGRQGPRF